MSNRTKFMLFPSTYNLAMFSDQIFNFFILLVPRFPASSYINECVLQFSDGREGRPGKETSGRSGASSESFGGTRRTVYQ